MALITIFGWIAHDLNDCDEKHIKSGEVIAGFAMPFYLDK